MCKNLRNLDFTTFAKYEGDPNEPLFRPRKYPRKINGKRVRPVNFRHAKEMSKARALHVQADPEAKAKARALRREHKENQERIRAEMEQLIEELERKRLEKKEEIYDEEKEKLSRKQAEARSKVNMDKLEMDQEAKAAQKKKVAKEASLSEEADAEMLKELDKKFEQMRKEEAASGAYLSVVEDNNRLVSQIAQEAKEEAESLAAGKAYVFRFFFLMLI